MWIHDAGHGQTLEVYRYNNSIYILFSLHSNEENSHHWSLEIGRIQFLPNSKDKPAEYSQFDRLTNIDYANYYGYKDKAGFGKLLRTDAAVSSDGKTLLIWKQNTNNKSELSGWEFAKINKFWDAKGVQTVSFKTHKPADLGRLFDFCDKNQNLHLPQKCQGIDISNKGTNGKYSIYLIKGNEGEESKKSEIEDDDGKNGKLVIYRFTSDGVIKSKRRINRANAFPTKKMEVEGIHIMGDKLHFLMVESSDCDQNYNKRYQYIMEINKSDMK